jgi:hypothetical protein
MTKKKSPKSHKSQGVRPKSQAKVQPTNELSEDQLEHVAGGVDQASPTLFKLDATQQTSTYMKYDYKE